MESKKLEWIQSLRGVAALMVLFFHMGPHWALSPWLSGFTGAMQWGFSGVDVFFVLSGFVVYRTASVAVHAHDTARFIRHRLLRVYLGYWPALLAFAFFTLVLLKRPAPSLEKTFFSALLLYPDMMDNWLLPAWSLTFELWFYAWIVGLALLNRSRPFIPVALALVALMAWNLGWLVFQRDTVNMSAQPLRYVLTPFGIEFLVGALCSQLYDLARRRGKQLAMPACALGAGAMVLGFAAGTSQPLFTYVEIMRVATFGLAALGFMLFALGLELRSSTPPQWLIAIGNASYGLYLLHTFLLDAFALVRMRMVRHFQSEWLLTAYLLLMPVAIVLIALWWYRRVERPLLKFALRKLG